MSCIITDQIDWSCYIARPRVYNKVRGKGYHRLGFDCEIQMIANSKIFRSLQSKELQSTTLKHNILLHGTGSTIAIIRFKI